jgi:hypothetical protein
MLLNPNRFGAGIVEPTPPSGLIGFWAGNNTANDSSPRDNNGSFGGGYVPDCPWVRGIVDRTRLERA